MINNIVQLGPSWTNGGPSAASEANEAAQTTYFNEVTQQASQTYAESQSAYNELIATWGPIFQAGPNQYGFSPAEDAALRGEIINTSANATAAATNATELGLAQSGGGKTNLPTGAEEQLLAIQNVLGGQAEATALQNEKVAGFEQGQANFEQASSAITGEQQILNPIGESNAATGAGKNATSAIQQVDSERTNILGSILGGVTQSVVGGLTGGLGTVVSNIGSGDFGW
jgi:hypothetical protein